MGVAGLIFASFMAIVRYVGSDMPAPQAAFLRYAFGLLFLLPFFVRQRLVDLRAVRWRLHMARGLMHGIGVMLWFYAMTRIPIAEVTALGFTAPVFATIGAVFFLGEKVRIRRILAVMSGLVGAIIILQPGFTVIDSGAVAMLIAAPIFATSDLIAKVLTRSESSPTVVAYLSVVVTLVTLGPALYVWRQPTGEEILLLTVTAGLATLGHICMVQGIKVADLSVTQPVKFLQLIWAALVGYLVFAETPAMATWAGAALIVASTSYIAHREAAARRRGEDSVRPSGARVGSE
jgi:drug/metabolite transporter (DMT)-like permease